MIARLLKAAFSSPTGSNGFNQRLRAAVADSLPFIRLWTTGRQSTELEDKGGST